MWHISERLSQGWEKINVGIEESQIGDSFHLECTLSSNAQLIKHNYAIKKSFLEWANLSKLADMDIPVTAVIKKVAKNL